MDEDREKLAEMSDKIRRGDYRVDPVAVADAILRRLRDLARARAEHVAGADRASVRHELRSNARSPRSRPANQ